VSRTAVIDAGVAIGWIQGRERSRASLDRLFRACRTGRIELVISVVNLAEVLIHTADLSRETGADPIALLTATRVRLHRPDEAVARRVARLGTSLADGFAAATAQEFGARLHTTDADLVRRLRGTRLPITHH
jgi:predicted nucleic acid-binding protein